MKKVLLTATVQSHIAQFHKPLVKMLHDHEYEVHVAARNNLAEKNGLSIDFVDKVFDIPFARSPKSFDNVKAYIQLKKIIDDGDYEVVHCNTPMGGIVTRLAAIQARKNGTKVFYTAHGFHFFKGASKKNWIVFYPTRFRITLLNILLRHTANFTFMIKQNTTGACGSLIKRHNILHEKPLVIISFLLEMFSFEY